MRAFSHSTSQVHLRLRVQNQPRSKAETADEKAVCADRALNDGDVEMAVLYTRLKPLLAVGAQDTSKGRRSPRSSGAPSAVASVPA